MSCQWQRTVAAMQLVGTFKLRFKLWYISVNNHNAIAACIQSTSLFSNIQ
jgi:hypothetical protein